MALFSLLVALFIERTVLLTRRWQFDHHFDFVLRQSQKLLAPSRLSFQLVAITGPAICTYILLDAVEGVLFGLVSLTLWTLIVLASITCLDYRALYKRYLLSICQHDEQASYYLASQLSNVEDINVAESGMLGARVGRQLSWINYRFYCAIIFMMMLGGPVAVVFYASLRTLDLLIFQRQLPQSSAVSQLLFIIDWLPVRLIALAYVFMGNFTQSINLWLKFMRQWRTPAYDVLTKVAMAAEQLSQSEGEAGLCMQSTCRLVELAKRTLVLLIVIMSLLTIFGILI